MKMNEAELLEFNNLLEELRLSSLDELKLYAENFERKLNVCLSKLNKKDDRSWEEIVEDLQLGIHYDTLRREAYGMEEYDIYNRIMKLFQSIENISKDNFVEEQLKRIARRELKVQKQEILLSDLKSELKRETREQARHEDLQATMVECCKILSEAKPFYPYDVLLPNEEDIIKEGVLLLSDLHFGAEIEHYWNVYNENEFNKRLNFLIQRVIELCKSHNVKKLNIMGIGDYIHGLIHTTTRVTSRMSVSTQTVRVAQAIACMVYEIASKLPNTYIVLSITDDNHSRIFAKKEDNTDKDTFVDLMKPIIKGRLYELDLDKEDKDKKLKNVIFLENHIDNGITAIKVCGYNIVGVHGDKDNKGQISLVRLSQLLDRNIDYLFMGHGHTPTEDTYGDSEVIMNGCFSGTDEYAKNLRLHSKPIQKFMIFSKEYGRECTYNIDVRGIYS